MSVTDLSFVSRQDDGKLNFWDVESSGDEDADRRKAQQLAQETSEFLRDGGAPTILPRIVERCSICRVGRYFLSAIAARLGRSA